MVKKWLKNFRYKCICIYSLLDLCFLPLQIFKYGYTRKMCVFLFIWFFFMVINFQNRYTGEWVFFLFLWFLFIVINFQKWVCRGMNVLFISMVLFYSYKFSKMGIHGEWMFFFCLKLKSSSGIAPKHTTLRSFSARKNLLPLLFFVRLFLFY